LKFALTILFTVITAVCSLSQSTDSLNLRIDNAIQNLQSVWNQNKTFATKGDTVNDRLLHTFLNYKVEHTNQSNVYADQLARLKAQLHHQDWGLRAGVAYLENLDPAPDDDNLFYFRRIQAGLTWDILKSGFVSHRYKEKVLINEADLQSKALSKEKKKEDYLSRWHSVIFMFNQIKVDILNNRQNIVQTQLEYAREFHRTKLLKKEDLIAIEAKMAEIEAMFNIYETYNDQLAPDYPTVVSYADNIPVFDINYGLLLNDFRQFTTDTVLRLTDDILKYKTSVIHDISLRTFLRYNWYDIVSASRGNRSFVSFGLNASIPIPFNHKLKQDIARTEFELEKFKGEESLNDIQKDLINDAYEYRYKLKQHVNFYEKRSKFLELLRQESVLLKLDPLDFNPIKALGLIDDILKIDIELVDLNQNMYLKILKLYTKLPYIKSRELVKPFAMPDSEHKENDITRSFYVWSSSVKKYSSEFITEYLRYNDADELVLSVNNDPDLDSARQALFNALENSKRPVHIMIGRNKLIHEGNMTNYLNELNLDSMSYAGIHLDIEPHTFDDWSDNKAKYLQKYNELLDETIEFASKGNKTVSISVPLHYPEAEMQKIISKVDKVYFMCYENVKTDYLIRKLSPYAGVANKLCIALRTEDFKSRIEMEQKFDDIRSQIGVSSFCLHDFDSVYQLDLKNVNQREHEEH
jgi:hypothetical protein